MSDWAGETAGLIERTVANVRERVVEPAESVGRIIVMGTLAALVGVTALVLVVLGAFHTLVIAANAATPGPNDNAWIAWMALGGILVVGGVLLWSERRPAGAWGASGLA